MAKTLIAVGKEFAATGQPVEPPAVVLGGEESTVMVKGKGGSGSPNQELVLSGALELDGPKALAAVDSEDGSSNTAGAIGDRTTIVDRASACDHLVERDLIR